MKRCAWCGRRFSPEHNNVKYCSSACREAAHLVQVREYRQRRVAEGTCMRCGNPVEPERRGKCLCRACTVKYAEWQREARTRTGELERRVCPVCGKEFTPNNASQKYCSAECRDAFWQKHRVECYRIGGVYVGKRKRQQEGGGT